MANPVLAIIVPCFNEEEVLKTSYFALYDVLKKLMDSEKISQESYICFVDDGSKDKSWEIIKKLSKYKEVKGLKLSKNFGHQKALIAGLSENEADVFITIDADLQDDVNVIEEMINRYSQGYEIVYGVRKDRNSDGFFKRNISQIYYKLSKCLGVNGIYNHADFRLVSKKITEVIKNSKERNIYLRGLIPSLGFKSCEVYYSRLKRIAGKPKYNLISLTKLAIDGITSFSVKPLHFISLIGILCFLIAIIMTGFSIFSYFYLKKVPGWASLFASIYLLGGIQLLSIGIIGEYIGKIYKETKQRPNFIIEETSGV